MKMINRVKSFVREESGQDLLEYALLVALIAVAIIVGAEALGISINDKLQGVADTISGT